MVNVKRHVIFMIK